MTIARSELFQPQPTISKYGLAWCLARLWESGAEGGNATHKPKGHDVLSVARLAYFATTA